MIVGTVVSRNNAASMGNMKPYATAACLFIYSYLGFYGMPTRLVIYSAILSACAAAAVVLRNKTA